MGLNTLKLIIFTFAFTLGLSACGNGGSINFMDEGSSAPPTSTNSVSAFDLVPASQALVIESGKTAANGYHAKLQLNPLKGQTLTAPGGYKANLKFTSRR